jgi:hypothetical protein
MSKFKLHFIDHDGANNADENMAIHGSGPVIDYLMACGVDVSNPIKIDEPIVLIDSNLTNLATDTVVHFDIPDNLDNVFMLKFSSMMTMPDNWMLFDDYINGMDK